MSSYQDVKQGSKNIEIQDEDQLQKEELDLILKTLEGMTSKFGSSFGGIKNTIRDVDDEIRMGNTRFHRLVDEIGTNFKNLQRKIIDEIKKKKENFRNDLSEQESHLQMSDSVMCADISHLCSLDTEKLTNVELLKEIRNNIDKLGKMMDKQFKEVVNALQQTIEESQRHSDEQDKLRTNVQIRFHEHEEFIRTNLLELL